MADTTNVKLGVCSISFNDVDLGHTKGGVEVTYTPEYYEKTVDQYGNTAYGQVLIGEALVAKVPLAEFTIANLAVAIPGGTDGTTKLTLGKDAGDDLASGAAELVLHPIANAAGDRSEDVVFYKALVINEITLGHMVDSEKLIEVEFKALIDESKSDGSYLGLIGDSAT